MSIETPPPTQTQRSRTLPDGTRIVTAEYPAGFYCEITWTNGDRGDAYANSAGEAYDEALADRHPIGVESRYVD